MPPYDERISDICEIINSGYNGILTVHPHKKTKGAISIGNLRVLDIKKEIKER